MEGIDFPVILTEDLKKKIQTSLMAMTQMIEPDNDYGMLVDNCNIAHSYMPSQLRHTLLETMARNHARDGNISEVYINLRFYE